MQQLNQALGSRTENTDLSDAQDVGWEGVENNWSMSQMHMSDLKKTEY